MSLKQRIEEGLEGKFAGLENGFKRLNDYIFGIQRNTNYLIGGMSGTYKTTLVDYMLLNAVEDAKKKGIKLNIFYYSYEIDQLTKQCNWLSVIVNQKYHVVIPPEKIKGLGTNRLTSDEKRMVDDCIPDMEEMFKLINFEFVPTNPTGIYSQLWNFFKDKGTFETEPYRDHEGNLKDKIIGFKHDDPNEMTIGVVDHIYCLKKERGFTVKEILDKFGEYCVQLKNIFGISFINIQQFNDGLTNIERQKFKGIDLSPQMTDFKDTRNLYQDSDVVLGTMNPYKMDMETCLGYNVDKLNGGMLMLKIIKNRLSTDNIAIGIFANPKSGSFSELPKPNEIDYSKYIN